MAVGRVDIVADRPGFHFGRRLLRVGMAAGEIEEILRRRHIATTRPPTDRRCCSSGVFIGPNQT